MELGISLLAHLKAFGTPPYIFVGSGISRRYLGLSDWTGLLKNLCELHKLDYGFLNSEAGGDLPLFATLIAKELQKKWWNDESYLESRAQYAHLVVDQESVLKIETARYIKSAAKLTTDPNLLIELELFKNVVADGVVTTNWDELLETLFPSHIVYVGQEGLIFSQIQGIAEIYKIHGTSSDPLSLVLTQADYKKFEQRNPYLASKLLTFFVENPVVFLGYSLNDDNILRIIYSILDCLSKENVLKLADRLVFIQWDKDCIEPRFERTILTHGGRSLPVYQGTTASMPDVLEALGKLKRKIPAKLLRILKQQIFDLVHTTTPGEHFFVQDIDENTPIQEIEVAMGVGILQKLRDEGYVALKRDNLIRDVVFGDQGLNVDAIVFKSLPELLKKSKYVPIFKYLSILEVKPDFDSTALDERLVTAKKRTLNTYRKTKGSGQVVDNARSFTGDFEDFVKENSFERTAAYWPYLKPEAFKATQIHKFLIDNFELMINHDNPNIKTSLFKLVCVYDLLVNVL